MAARKTTTKTAAKKAAAKAPAKPRGSAAKTAARGYNMARGEETNAVRWSEEFLAGLTRSALLRYLAVAHFGRGRGEWEEGEHPTHWQAAVEKAVASEQSALRSAWDRAKDGLEAVADALQPVLAHAAKRLLVGLYPEAEEIFAADRHEPRRLRHSREGGNPAAALTSRVSTAADALPPPRE